MQAVLCPVCNGSGKVKKKTCHGCDGKGWVSVGTDYPPWHNDPWKPYEPWEPSPYPWEVYKTWWQRALKIWEPTWCVYWR